MFRLSFFKENNVSSVGIRNELTCSGYIVNAKNESHVNMYYVFYDLKESQ